MLIMIYAFAWVLVAAAAAILFVTGGLNEVTASILSFVTATLFFAGIVVVLPWWVDKRFSPKY